MIPHQKFRNLAWTGHLVLYNYSPNNFMFCILKIYHLQQKIVNIMTSTLTDEYDLLQLSTWIILTHRSTFGDKVPSERTSIYVYSSVAVHCLRINLKKYFHNHLFCQKSSMQRLNWYLLWISHYLTDNPPKKGSCQKTKSRYFKNHL